jgi:hypothetical protein
LANKFVSFLEQVGHDLEIALVDVVKYLPAASILAGFIFPPAVAPLAAANVAADLLQKAVVEVEQKLAAKPGSGPQKLATVLTIVSSSVEQILSDPAVASELSKHGITIDQSYISRLISAVVSFLNVQGVVTVIA